MKIIVLTHGHYDHVGAVNELKEYTGAIVVAHEEEKELIQNPNLSLGTYFDPTFSHPEVDSYVKEGEFISAGNLSFRVIHTPGHTPGSACFAAGEYLFSGDTALASGFGRYDLWGGDKAAIAQSLARIANLEGEYKVCPGHGNTASLSRIRDQLFSFSEQLKQK